MIKAADAESSFREHLLACRTSGVRRRMTVAPPRQRHADSPLKKLLVT